MLHCTQDLIEQDRNMNFVSLCFQRLSILFHFISFYPLYAALHTTTSMRRGEPSNILENSTMDIKIVLDVVWGDYIVPGIDGTEAQAYYTDDKEDAYDTARAIFGQDVTIKLKRKYN